MEKRKKDKAQQKEYRELSLRRVRLGIMLAEFSRVNEVIVTEEELRKAVFDQARGYPGQEQKIIELYQKNPNAIEQLKGPILEDKVVDIILSKAKITDKKTSIGDLVKYHESQD